MRSPSPGSLIEDRRWLPPWRELRIPLRWHPCWPDSTAWSGCKDGCESGTGFNTHEAPTLGKPAPRDVLEQGPSRRKDSIVQDSAPMQHGLRGNSKTTAGPAPPAIASPAVYYVSRRVRRARGSEPAQETAQETGPSLATYLAPSWGSANARILSPPAMRTAKAGHPSKCGGGVWAELDAKGLPIQSRTPQGLERARRLEKHWERGDYFGSSE
jgi:hypothetical protein